MALFTDRATAAIEAGLSGVAQRQRVTSHNIANVATPGFKSSKVDFEESLAAAVQQGDPARTDVAVRPTGNPERLDGNDVALEEEMTTLVKSGLQYNALVEALNFKLGLLRTAIGRR